MKWKITQLLILLLVLLIEDYLFYLFIVSFGTRLFIYIADFLVKSILIFLILEIFIYKVLFSFNSSKIRVLFFILIPLALAFHISHRLVAIDRIYFVSKDVPKRTSKNLWRFDDNLAHRAMPNSKGNYIYYIGDSIKGEVPVIFDSMGYRTVPDSLKLNSNLKDLYLGDSFTFGDFVNAENTYPYLTSNLLHHSYVNAGASAYGIGQMYQIAKKLIPKYKFNYIFIQLSPWLTERAMNLNGSTNYGYLPFPYFSKSADSFKLNLSVYKTRLLRSVQINLRETKISYFEKLRFMVTDGFKIEVTDYYPYKFAALKVKMGLIAKPTSDKPALENYFYDYLIELCNKNSSTPVILKLRYNAKDCQQLIDHISNRAIVVDLDHDLDSIIINKRGTFENVFGIYHHIGKDSIFVDSHPNTVAHDIMAHEIFKTLTEAKNH
jgi:hypothetical protein